VESIQPNACKTAVKSGKTSAPACFLSQKLATGIAIANGYKTQ